MPKQEKTTVKNKKSATPQKKKVRAKNKAEEIMEQTPVTTEITGKSAWKYYIECITKKYFCFKGRARRKEFWGFRLYDVWLFWAIALLLAFLFSGFNIANKFNILWTLVFFFPYLGVTVRRLHDVGLSGWILGSFFIIVFATSFVSAGFAIAEYQSGVPAENSALKTILFCFIGLAALILFIIFLVSLFLPSKKEANKYGPVPEGNDRHLIWIILGALFPAALNIFALGIIGGYSQSMMKYRVTKTEDELAQLVDGARTLFAGQKNYAALIDETIVQYKLLPEENIQQDNNHYRFTNPYNGTLSVSVGSANHFADQRALQIKITEIPAEACIDLAKLYWQTPQSGFIAAMITNGNSAYDKYIDSVTAYNCKNSVQPEYAIVCGNNPSPTSFEHIKSGCHFNHNTMILKFF